MAYARILKSDDELEPVVIGRVVVSEALRGEKLGQQLMSKTLDSCARHWPDKPIYLGAQAHLQRFTVVLALLRLAIFMKRTVLRISGWRAKSFRRNR